MLYWLLYEQLFPQFTPFRIFGYVTFRTLAASITALLLSILLGPWFIRRLQSLQIGQHIREEGPESHQKKAGTPTMGGLLILTSVIIPTLLFTNLRNPYVWVALFGLVSYGIIGFLDDYAKVKKARNLGLTARQKLLLQILMMVCLGVWLLVLHSKGLYDTAMNVPFLKNVKPNLLIPGLLGNPWTYPLAFIFFFGFLFFVIVGSSNAVNLTDGLDGLAAGLMIVASGAMTILSYVSGHAQFAHYLGLTRLSGTAELTIFCASLTGASLGFLWYNAHPAEVFMGDVGSLALGGSLGIVSVLIKQEILLIFIGGVYVIELLSVVIQVVSFKTRGKRVFLMAPIHHHFEKKGWDETKVVVRFWIAGLVMALFALTTLKLR
ncbi:phospho-N-acetylmuramoyl-pentapeptide-transferase [Paludibaculum fermentans]|uniref:Phospho-N-acetylmuramoyl-pentapeptide-transferase n=1 Tax=Paludibaculum fermentans TaxID=1473598 RepID=A0A7S7NXH9_PALFE|nr:phospho-N-acetylmuramoyl-pentapeptide-transferase [Paludibaculum fermentans]QOY91623.1 phospho-N-acetylmuramoyl-pentapeptide-transferase [Paludibaculum fermentans]